VSDSAENVSPEDQIDYGTGEGAAYGGTDTDAPIFVPHPHEGNTSPNEGNADHPTNAKYQKNIAERVWLRIKGFFRIIFSSSSAWNAVASIVIAVATVVYVVYAHRQWVAMSGQLSEMHDSTASAKTAAADTLGEMQRSSAASDQQFQTQLKKLDSSIKEAQRLAKATEDANANVVNSDRPWMGGVIDIQNFTAGNSAKISWAFSNSGKRPAVIDEAAGTDFVFPVFPIDPDPRYGNISGASKAITVPGNMVNKQYTSAIKLNTSIMSSINSGGVKYFVIAKVNYRDIQTNTKYWTHVCKFYEPPSKNGDDGVWQNCTDYNDAK